MAFRIIATHGKTRRTFDRVNLRGDGSEESRKPYEWQSSEAAHGFADRLAEQYPDTDYDVVPAR